MFQVATAYGFLVINKGQKYEVNVDSRVGTAFTSFDEADLHAKQAVNKLFQKSHHYYSILQTVSGH